MGGTLNARKEVGANEKRAAISPFRKATDGKREKIGIAGESI